MREETVAATHEQFCQLAGASRDLVALASADGRLLYMNAAGRHALGLDESSALPETVLFDCLPVDQHSRVRHSLFVVGSGAPGAADHFDLCLKHRGTGATMSAWWQAFLLAPVPDCGVRAVAIVAQWLETKGSRILDDLDPRGAIAKEVAALELLSAHPAGTSVTAQLLGVVPLHQRAPREYWDLFERYVHLLDLALDRHAYKTGVDGASTELRAIAERLGSLDAGAREVADLHARALRQKIRTATMTKAQAYTAEGRLVAFELMGHLVSFYRRRGGVAPQEERG
jgi:hypothetical protein